MTFTNNNFGNGGGGAIINNNDFGSSFASSNGDVFINNNGNNGFSFVHNNNINLGQTGPTFVSKSKANEAFQPIFVMENNRKVIIAYNLFVDGVFVKKVNNPLFVFGNKIVDLNEIINLIF